MSGLPDEVLDHLAVHTPLRLVTRENGVAMTVSLAPLTRQLYILVPRHAPALQTLWSNPSVELVADAPEYLIRIRGRAVGGRSANAESCRSELVHWIAPGTSLSSSVALRFYPEHLDYQKGPKENRWKAAGPVPGGDLGTGRWWRMLTAEMVGWLPVLAAIDWLWLLFVAEEKARHLIILFPMLLVSLSCFWGATLLGQYGSFLRWKEGSGDERAAKGLLAGEVAPAALPPVAAGLLIGGTLLGAVLSFGAGSQVWMGAMVASGVWWYGPMQGVKHLFRRADVAEGR